MGPLSPRMVRSLSPAPSQQTRLSAEPVLKVPEISETITEHEHTSDLWVDFITQLAPVWTPASMENSWNPSYSPPAAVFWDLKKRKKKKKWCGIFKVSPGALLLDLLFPPRLFQLRFFKLCYLVISTQPQCTCLTLETKRAPSCQTAEWRWQERKLTQHSIGNQPWAAVDQGTRGNSAVQPGAGTQSD